ncbi:YitT family protein [Gemmiger formicilis]|nr:YitT family protein [Gemmiger formicilis]
MKEKAKRYLVFLVGLFISSLGVSLITKADLGTSPISAIPYVLSLHFPLTLGQFTVAFSLFLILLQLLMLRRRFKAEHLLQIPISVAFIDPTMVLLDFLEPQAYPAKVVSLLIGCVVLAFGVFLEVLGDVAMLPGESFVRAVVSIWKTDFGTTKICFDVSMTVIAVVASFVLAGLLTGVREGTLIAALLVGFIARLFALRLAFLEPLLFGDAADA